MDEPLLVPRTVLDETLSEGNLKKFASANVPPFLFFFFFLSVMKMDLDSVRREITLPEGAEQALGWDSQATPAMGVRKSEK